MKTESEEGSEPNMTVPDSTYHARYEEMESLEQELTFDYTGLLFRRKGLPFDDGIKKSLHLTEDDHFTNLAYILSDQFEHPAEAALFNNEHDPRVLDRGEYTGSVLEQLNGILRFTRIHNTLRSSISDISRIDEYAYPPDALNDIIVDVFAHRDYSMNGTILINMYPGHMSISSPGGVNGPHTADVVTLGASSLRNPNLTHIMYCLGYIKTFGSGIQNIMRSYKGYTQPIIRSTQSVFYVQLPSLLRN